MAEGTGGEEIEMKKIKEVLLANDEDVGTVNLGAGLHFNQSVKFIFDLGEDFSGSVTAFDKNDNFIYLDDGYHFDEVCSVNIIIDLIPKKATTRLRNFITSSLTGDIENIVLAHISKSISNKLILKIEVDPDEGYEKEPPKKLLVTLSTDLDRNRGMAKLYSAAHPFSKFPFISFNQKEYEEELRDNAKFYQECHDDKTNLSDYAREEDTPTAERMDEGINDGGELFNKEFKSIFCSS